MKGQKQIDQKNIDELFEKLSEDAKSSGYHLNPDIEFTKALIEGLITNQKRYGYASCPCRLASGNKADDLDIICPCDYRDQDIDEYGACYCALYVSRAVADKTVKVAPIPERRLPAEERKIQKAKTPTTGGKFSSLSYPVWRCRVCGYLCARDNPPDICPVCKAKQERFERFI